MTSLHEGVRHPGVMAESFCTACGRPLAPESRFCGACGTPVGDPAGTPAALPGSPPTLDDPRPPPPPPAPGSTPVGEPGQVTAFTRRGLRALGGWTEGLVLAVAVMQLPALWFAIRQRQLVSDLLSPDGNIRTLQDLVDAEDAWIGIVGLTFLTAIAAFVLSVIWLYRVDGQVRSLGATDLRLPRGFAIGAWFIPIANVVLLNLILSDLDRTARANGVPIGSAWRQRRTGAVVWIWTAAAAAFYVGMGMGTTGEDELISGEDAETIANGRVLGALALGVAMAAFAFYVRRVRGNLDRATALADPAHPTSAGAAS